jgi:GNAT superfamily N-acetyltransferase
MLSAGYGEIFIATVKERVVGLIGAIFSPSLFNGELTALVHFWYARQEVRGNRVGTSLFRHMMQEAKRREASAVLAGHILTVNEDGFRVFFENEGFVLREMVYRKELT